MRGAMCESHGFSDGWEVKWERARHSLLLLGREEWHGARSVRTSTSDIRREGLLKQPKASSGLASPSSSLQTTVPFTIGPVGPPPHASVGASDVPDRYTRYTYAFSNFRVTDVASMPEWSKGFDSSSNSASCTGSNPVRCILNGHRGENRRGFHFCPPFCPILPFR